MNIIFGYLSPLAIDNQRDRGEIFNTNHRRILSKRLIGSLLVATSVITILIALNIIPNQLSWQNKWILLGTIVGFTACYWACLAFRNLESRSFIEKIKRNNDTESKTEISYFEKVTHDDYTETPIINWKHLSKKHGYYDALKFVNPFAIDNPRNKKGDIVAIYDRRIWSKRLLGTLLAVSALIAVLVFFNIIPNALSAQQKTILLGSVGGSATFYWLCLAFRNLESRSFPQKGIPNKLKLKRFVHFISKSKAEGCTVV